MTRGHLQTLGFVAAQQEKYGQATKYFADAIATGGLPPRWPSRCATTWPSSTWRRNFEGSINTMKEWFANLGKDEKPTPHAYITLANAHVQLKRYRKPFRRWTTRSGSPRARRRSPGTC